MASDLIRKVDVQKILKALYDNRQYSNISIALLSAMEDIHDLPTGDAVEVVRCKDCRFSDCRQSFREGETYCTISCLLVGNNEYCSNGAKMDGGEEE